LMRFIFFRHWCSPVNFPYKYPRASQFQQTPRPTNLS
jgi:hypothetical protein